MIIACAKKSPDGDEIGIIIIGLDPKDLEQLVDGGAIRREFSEIDNALGEGTLVVAGVESEEQFLAEIRKRFDIGHVRRATT